jgi:Fe-S-cluster containining protein
MNVEKESCNQCGNCCKQGGPALHLEDLELVRSGKIPMSSLITLRKGELVNNPKSGTIQPSSVELVKLIGTGREWNCCYYSDKIGCTIYEDRPQACRVLKCWDTAEILSIVEKDTLTRLTLLEDGDPLIPVIKEHERLCSCKDLGGIYLNLKQLSRERKMEIEKLVRSDLHFRSRVIQDFDLKLNQELFYFGRPYFQLLQQLGIKIFEQDHELFIDW